MQEWINSAIPKEGETRHKTASEYDDGFMIAVKDTNSEGNDKKRQYDSSQEILQAVF
jgi:hypothetical protein